MFLLSLTVVLGKLMSYKLLKSSQKIKNKKYKNKIREAAEKFKNRLSYYLS
jgi:hypothetical protein